MRTEKPGGGGEEGAGDSDGAGDGEAGAAGAGAGTGRGDDKVSVDAKLLELARQQRMNTDARRQVFVALMGADDAEGAMERALRLGLKVCGRPRCVGSVWRSACVVAVFGLLFSLPPFLPPPLLHPGVLCMYVGRRVWWWCFSYLGACLHGWPWCLSCPHACVRVQGSGEREIVRVLIDCCGQVRFKAVCACGCDFPSHTHTPTHLAFPHSLLSLPPSHLTMRSMVVPVALPGGDVQPILRGGGGEAVQLPQPVQVYVPASVLG